MDWLFIGPDRLRHAAFTDDNLIHVMRFAAGLAETYDGTNSTNLAIFFYFFRGAYFSEAYVEGLIFSRNVDQAMVEALDAFIENAHFYDVTDEHGFVLWEVFVCLDSLDAYRAHYLPAVKGWLSRFGVRHAEHWHLVAATNSLFYWLYRGHWDDEYLEAALSDVELMNVLRNLALLDELLQGDAAVLVENAGGELARFLQYPDAPVYGAAHRGARSILAHYGPVGPGAYVWIRVVRFVYYLDACVDFRICGIIDRIEDLVLSIDYSCGRGVHFRVQDMTPSQLLRACGKLIDLEIFFHQQLETRWEPVAGDLNSTLEVVVFKNWDNYDLYSGLLFGNDTNNGGIYLEGDPSDPSNTARFIAHLADWLPDTPVWNLEHEYVHYLDGRFNMAGAFWDYGIHSHKTLWWIEGLAEYVSKWSERASVVEYAAGGLPPLSEVFGITYGHGESVYPISHLAMWFMLNRHGDDTRTFRDFLRLGHYDGYLGYLNDGIGAKYDEEWQQWLRHLGDDKGPRGLEPDAVGRLPDRMLTLRRSLSVNVSPAFADPDGGDLRYAVSSSAPGVVAARAEGGRVILTAAALGGAEIEVTATDARGASATASFRASVTAAFTDDPLRPGATPVRAVHFTELRQRIDVLRREAGLAGYRWTDPVLHAGVTVVRLVHLLELRAAVSAAYGAAGRAAPRWTDAAPTVGSLPIRAAHLTELRAAVRALEAE